MTQTNEDQSQVLFDKVVSHLRKQGCKSTDRNYCLYRGPNGHQCAFGCLIPDSIYDSSMEKTRCEFVINKNPELHHLKPYLLLLERLQNIHDSRYVDQWEAEFKSLARCFELKYTSP